MTAVPTLVVVTDRHAAARAGRSVADVVVAAVEAGAPAVLFRDKDLGPTARRSLGEQVAGLVARAGAMLLVASDPELARHLGADAIHLAAHDAHPGGAAAGMLVGRSCHDDAEVAAAVREQADLLLVSPVAPTASKPGHGPALGPERFRRLVGCAAGVPVLALGGVTPENASRWRDAGAHGVAVMGGVMAAPDPADTVRRLLDARELP
ncbi:MAG: thiamine phosphate synthase [Actinobacteria bacterium]|jgi:thiamine-phosphate pyrophosphorylase|nr:thiamine phosphate synthase [Actinomycetota bacterium]